MFRIYLAGYFYLISPDELTNMICKGQTPLDIIDYIPIQCNPLVISAGVN